MHKTLNIEVLLGSEHGQELCSVLRAEISPKKTLKTPKI